MLREEDIWRGDRQWNEFHYLVPDKRTGECWGISANFGGEGIVKMENRLFGKCEAGHRTQCPVKGRTSGDDRTGQME